MELTAKGVVVTQTGVGGSQTPEMEAELLSAEVDDRGVTEDAAIAGSDFAQKAMEIPVKREAEGKVLPMEEAVDRSQESKGFEEGTAVKDVQSTKMGRRFCCV